MDFNSIACICTSFLYIISCLTNLRTRCVSKVEYVVFHQVDAVDAAELRSQLISLCDTQSRRWTAPRDKKCRELHAQLKSMGASLDGIQVVDEPVGEREKNRFHEDEEVRTRAWRLWLRRVENAATSSINFDCLLATQRRRSDHGFSSTSDLGVPCFMLGGVCTTAGRAFSAAERALEY